MNKFHLDSLRLCLVSDMRGKSFKQYQSFLMQALEGGVTSVQLREKKADLSAFRDLAGEFKNLLDDFNVPLIINDHVDIAKEIDAAGVHIGQSDMSPDLARSKVGPNKIIGWSIESWDALMRANELDAIDYIAASAVFPSKSKSNLKTLWGIAGLGSIVKNSKHPVISIGGITLDNLKEVMNTGVNGVAIIAAIHDAIETKKTVEALIREINLCSKK